MGGEAKASRVQSYGHHRKMNPGEKRTKKKKPSSISHYEERFAAHPFPQAEEKLVSGGSPGTWGCQGYLRATPAAG